MKKNIQTDWEDQFSVEQIQAAKKTVTITYEIEGKTYSAVYNGTNGLAVLVADEHHTTGKVCAPFEKVLHIAISLLARIYQQDPFALMAVVDAVTRAETLDDDDDQEPDCACH